MTGAEDRGIYLAYADPTGIQLRQVATGETHRVPDTRSMDVYGWASDGTKVRAGECANGACIGWDIPLVGGPRRQTGAKWPDNETVDVSPDGSRLHVAINAASRRSNAWMVSWL